MNELDEDTRNLLGDFITKEDRHPAAEQVVAELRKILSVLESVNDDKRKSAKGASWELREAIRDEMTGVSEASRIVKERIEFWESA